MVIFANRMDPDQAQHFQNNGPDLDPNCLTMIVFLKDFFWKKNQQTPKYMKTFPACKELNKNQTNNVLFIETYEIAMTKILRIANPICD